MSCCAVPRCALLCCLLCRRVLAVLAKVGLGDEPITMRMTGCPNGCARPYMAEIGFVGDGPNSYQVGSGGCCVGGGGGAAAALPAVSLLLQLFDQQLCSCVLTGLLWHEVKSLEISSSVLDSEFTKQLLLTCINCLCCQRHVCRSGWEAAPTRRGWPRCLLSA